MFDSKDAPCAPCARFTPGLLLALCLGTVAVVGLSAGSGPGALAQTPDPSPAAGTSPLRVADDAQDTGQSDQEVIRALIRDLGAADFETREAATRRLIARGSAARALLEEATRSEDAEVRGRATEILDRIRTKDRAELRRRSRRSPDQQDSRSLDMLDLLRRSDPFARRGFPRHDSLWRDMAELLDRNLEDSFAPGTLDRDIQRMREQAERMFRQFQGNDSRGSRSWRSQIWRNGEKILDQSVDESFGHLPELGARVGSLPEVLRSHLSLDDGGVLVEHVDDPGQDSILQRHDVILKVDDRVVHSVDDVIEALRRTADAAHTPVASTKVEIIRKGKLQTVWLPGSRNTKDTERKRQNQ